MKTALITPSHAPDFERCAGLVASAQRWVTGLDKHYLLVDRRDLSLFRPLAQGRVELVAKEDLLPTGFRSVWGSRRWWWNPKGLPVRGWIVQQVTKLAVTDVCDADACVYADSDMLFVRPWNAQSLWRGSALRLFRDERRGVMFRSARYRNWYAHAARHLGHDNPQQLTGGYIAQLASLRRDRMLELQQRVANLSGRPWKEALLRTLDFSEFVLYGTFVEHGCHMAGHYTDDQPLCLSSWYHNIETAEDLKAFIGHLAPHHVGVHIQSNLRIPPAVYQSWLEAGLPSA